MVNKDSEMKDRIIKAIRLTYESIATDLGNHDLDEAIEITLDADRVRSYGYDKEAAEVLYALSWGDMYDLGRDSLRTYFCF